MRRGLIPTLLLGFLLAGCGSSTNPPPSNTGTMTDTATSTVTPTSTVTVTSTVTATSTVTDVLPDASINSVPDAGCDEDAVGENYFIQNCTSGGNGTPILRQLPTVVANHCNPS